MDFVIWHSTTENKFMIGQQVNREVFECDRTEYMRILYRFPEDKESDALRIHEKLQNEAGKLF